MTGERNKKNRTLLVYLLARKSLLCLSTGLTSVSVCACACACVCVCVCSGGEELNMCL